jgi:hypothetical protein
MGGSSTGSAGSVSVTGASTAALPLGGAAQGLQAVAGSNTAALPLTGTATGTFATTLHGSSIAALPLSGTISGWWQPALYPDLNYRVMQPKRNFAVAATMYPRSWAVQSPTRTFTINLTRSWAITQAARIWSI